MWSGNEKLSLKLFAHLFFFLWTSSSSQTKLLLLASFNSTAWVAYTIFISIVCHVRKSEATTIKEIVKAVSELTMYDVFLSFRGNDVCENFTRSLNEALAQKGIKAFMDSKKLLMGQDFPSALKHSIEQSRTYVVVFSENYAESRWCLKELVQILEWKNKRKQRMLPIFYQVEPGEVRGQKQSYEKALAKHAIDYGMHKAKKWGEALAEAANLNGIHLQDGNKDDWIPSIVEEIENMMA